MIVNPVFRRFVSALENTRTLSRVVLWPATSRRSYSRIPITLAAVSTPIVTGTIDPLTNTRSFSSSAANMAQPSTIYEFKYVDIDGKEQSLEKYRGKVLIIVNVASKCGYTKSNYEDLSELYDKYKDEGLAVLGFPCDQFGNQEPATESEIKNFVCTRYKASFDMAKKVNVNGSDAHPLWVFLKSKQGGTLGDFIKWNFTKFVVDKKGQVVKRYGPSTNPKEFESKLVELLKE